MDALFAGLTTMFSQMQGMVSALMAVWFVVLPPLLWYLFFELWIHFAWGQYGSKLSWVLLEIIPPRDIEKSPLPMESIFAGFAGVEKTSSAAEEFIKGEFPVSFSLELVSTEGRVHFYVRTQVGFRHLVEAHFYGQYPNVEIIEVPDYVHDVPRAIPNKDWDLWGTDFILTKPDLYPIKTYKFFEESVTGKMIDPLSGLVETMGKLGPGQHLWFQMIVSPIHPKWTAEGQLTVDEFLGRTKEAKPSLLSRFFAEVGGILSNIVNGLMARELVFGASAEAEKKDEQPVEFRLTPGEKDVLKALQTNLGKQMFRTRMRMVYLGRREVFDKPLGVSAFVGGIKQFNDQNLNGFKPDDLSKTYGNYIMGQARMRYRQRRIFRRFITRDNDPFKTRFLLSTEELATVYHIPDMSVVAPSLAHVAAKKGGAPTNLPVQEFE